MIFLLKGLLILDPQMIFSIILFIIIYSLIIWERFNNTIAALLGAAILIISGIMGESEAISYVDFSTLGLLIGMMIIVIVLKHSGLFEYIAITEAKRVNGNPISIMIALTLITAVASALLDNVTTIMLIVPVTLVIFDILKINPIPLVIFEILASNIGGTATLIGDPPNLMIGSANNIGFTEFLFNLGPLVAVIMVLLILYIKHKYKNQFTVTEEQIVELNKIDTNTLIKDKGLMIKGIIVLSVVIIFFFLYSLTGISSSTIAMLGASFLLLISKLPVNKILEEIEWETIFFFIGLFILVGGLEKTGVIDSLAQGIIGITDGNYILLILGILWISALASAFINNIPFVATMIPLIQTIGNSTDVNIMPLWWALAIGACLGGNGTLVGASANVIASGLLKSNGYNLKFKSYFKLGFPIMIISIIISSIYIVLFLI